MKGVSRVRLVAPKGYPGPHIENPAKTSPPNSRYFHLLSFTLLSCGSANEKYDNIELAGNAGTKSNYEVTETNYKCSALL